MAIKYPCQIGLPDDLDPAISGIIFLCSDFRIIQQDHDGTEVAHQCNEDPKIVWAAESVRNSYRFQMVVLQDPDWLEYQVRLANGNRKDFLRLVFLQKRKTKHNVPHLGWSFCSMPDTDETLREWMKMVWPELYRPNLDVLTLRRLVPQDEKESAGSPFIAKLHQELFGWFSQLRAA